MKKQEPKEVKRLQSLDALRGFDMFWIMGGEGIFIALGAITGWPVLEWVAEQCEHVPWHGFHFYDMIFPLFLFIAGISFPFSFAKRYHGEKNRNALYMHIFKRGFTLVVLGIIYNNAVNFDFANLRYGSVLGHIGLAWMFAALIYINTGLRFRIVWLAGILLGYWLLLVLFPATDLGATDPFSMEGSLVGYIDRVFMPGRLYLKVHDPEGLLSIVPAIATALLGMLTGQFVMTPDNDKKPMQKVAYMAIASVVLVVVGVIWNFAFPINKNLWTSSFVCLAGGLSLMLFTLFYLIIDVLNYKKWTFFFTIIGLNSITIYLAHAVIDFEHTTKFLFGGFISLFDKSYEPLLGSIAYVAVGWIFLYFLYTKKIFLKV